MTSQEQAWVLLVECHNMVELQILRTTLDARGVPCRIDGEHTLGVLGSIDAAAMQARVLVPRPALATARELVEDIVGPFAEQMQEDDDAEYGSPYRTAVAEEEDNDDDKEKPILRRKSYAVLLLVLFLGFGPLLGFSHRYVNLNRRAGILALSSVFALAALYRGASWAGFVLGAVWIADLIGGAFGILAHNRRVDALIAGDEFEEEEKDAEEDAEEDEDEADENEEDEDEADEDEEDEDEADEEDRVG